MVAGCLGRERSIPCRSVASDDMTTGSPIKGKQVSSDTGGGAAFFGEEAQGYLEIQGGQICPIIYKHTF